MISSGLKAGEMVVVGGLQQIRPKMKVQTDEVPMPSLASPDLPAAKAQNPPEGPSKGQPPVSGASGKSQG